MQITKTRHRIRQALLMLIPLSAIALIMLRSEAALDSARNGFVLCAQIIAPSLFPFFVLSGILTGLGFPYYLGKLAQPVMSRLFGVGGSGAAAFILGISGGYPLGAATVAEMYKSGECTSTEAERLLAFCNNSGPAFIIGAAGTGIFNNPGAGVVMYLSHVLAAGLVGALMARGADSASSRLRLHTQGFAEAFSEAVKTAAASTITICAFVMFFSVVIGIINSLGLFSRAAFNLSAFTGLGLDLSRTILTGALELGNGIGALHGVPFDAKSAAVASFILGWGGLSIHCQTLAIAGIAGLSMKLHTIGKLLHGFLSALLTFCATLLFFA